MSENDETVILLHETVRQSVTRDAVSFVAVVGVIGTGWLLQSGAMQWMGFLMLLLAALGRAARHKHDNRMTPQEAADHLHQKFGVRAETQP